MEIIKYFLEFTFYSGWTFFGMILLLVSLSGLFKSLFSFIPNKIHFGGTFVNNETPDKVKPKKKN